MSDSSNYNNSSFFYVDNINILKANRNHIIGQQFVIAPFSYTFTQDNETISGISYELYYIDEDKNFNQLTYTFKEGNGLTIDENLCVDLNIDNYSLIDNENNELSINEESFTTAYYNTRGILHASDNLYINDILIHNYNEIGSLYSDNGILSVNNGLLSDLKELKKYYESCLSLNDKIDFLYSSIINKKLYFNVGDFLYKDEHGNLTTEKIGPPYMICVIASNVIDDRIPRFTLIKRNTNASRFSSDSKIPIKKAYGNIPVYNNEYKNVIIENGPITGARGGYFALEREGWEHNLKNRFNNKENFSLPPYDTVESVFLDWYIDQYYVNTTELYKIDKKGVFSEPFNMYGNNDTLIIKSKVKFKDGFIGQYIFNLEYNNISKRYELIEDCLPIVNQNEPQENNTPNLIAGTYYNYSISIPAGMFDLDKVYLVCYLAKDENCTSWYDDPQILEYDNSIGIQQKTFDISQTHTKGGIKIKCYSSRYNLDIYPYDLGILKPSTIEYMAKSSDGTITYYRKKIILIKNDIINLNISKYIPTEISIINHLNNQGESIYPYFMFNTNGKINNGSYGIINIYYTFDVSYINDNGNQKYLNYGCIKIMRADNYDFNFSQCQTKVKIKADDINGDTQVITLNNIIFKKNNKVLESEIYELNNYNWTFIRSVEINGFDYIADLQSSEETNYNFNNQANILNNN